jgi:hypothetical protein
MAMSHGIKFLIGEAEHILFVRAPRWSDMVKAERLAKLALKDAFEQRKLPNGEPAPLNREEYSKLNIQIGIELAKICAETLDSNALPETFWSELRFPMDSAIGMGMVSVMFGGEVGPKN